MEAGSVQDLVCIDVADTGDSLLMQEQRFQATAPSFDQPDKLLRCDGQRVGPEPAGAESLKPCFI